ncbi:TetR/AcrR family transcriptional regulator [Pseudomonas sp. PDM31]|uniref:TetR/AcrR family transcriptional regulator n=1 Tax=Pseudomonas sp. PDM31 TaxID=2854778 RepID=UPI001C4631AA|nr:TetR/AcrR family transcriptional regulator [Pseudomonas sp. PDM31]MBV7477527.1 TetR/AcrR family transcriptional regulator [Pseudomonas sp. PDM31]
MSRAIDTRALPEGQLLIEIPETQRKQPRQARSIAMVEALKQAAVQILEDEGRDALSLSRLSEYSGVSVSSIYEYFPTLDSLISSIFDEYRKRQHAELLEDIRRLPDSSMLYDGLLLMLRTFLRLRRKQWLIDRVFSAKYLHYSELQRMDLVKPDSLPQAELTSALMQRFSTELAEQDAEKAMFLAYHALPALTRAVALERPLYLEQDDTAQMIARMLHALLCKPNTMP